MAETGLTRSQLIVELTRSPYGDLESYLPVGLRYAEQDPDFFAHLVSWNHAKGSVRDAKVALPVIALDVAERLTDDVAAWRVLTDNALAHLADLRPRQLVQALAFTREAKTMVNRRLLRRFVTRYLRDLETDWRTWERTALQHREALRTLYAQWHIAPGGTKGSRYDETLLRSAAVTGKFAAVRTLAHLPANEIADVMRRHQIPFLIARGALGARAKEPYIALALLQAMSPVEVVNNTRALERLGVRLVPELRAAFEQALERAGTSKKTKHSTLKATRAAEALEASGETQLAGKLRALQERQLDNAAGIEGNWLVLGDKSSSMSTAIELARQVSGILARMVKGTVHVVFFDTAPRAFDVTGKTYEDIKAVTALVRANGCTSIGCGLQWCVENKVEVDGLAVVSDGGQNTMPSLPMALAAYDKLFGRLPTVYFFKTPGDPDRLTAECGAAGVDVQVFDLRTGGAHGAVDYYSLPTLVETLRANRYSLVDEVYAAPLRTLDEVLPHTRDHRVLRRVPAQVPV